MWWKDSNFSASNVPTPQHPVGEWTLSQGVNITGVEPSTSLGYTNYLVYQSADGTIQGANVLFFGPNNTAPEDTIVSPTDRFTISLSNGEVSQNVTGILSTHLSNTALRTESEGVILAVFFQVEGDGIQQYNRDGSGGEWYTATTPVSNSTTG